MAFLFLVIHINTESNFCMMLIILAPQFLQIALISFGTSVNSFHANVLLQTSSATVLPSKEHNGT